MRSANAASELCSKAPPPRPPGNNNWNQPHDDLGRFGLSAARLSRDDDAGVFPGPLHRLVGGLGDGEDVRSSLEDLPALETRKAGLKTPEQPSNGLRGEGQLRDQ